MADTSAATLALIQSPSRRLAPDVELRKGKLQRPSVLEAVLESSGNRIWVETQGAVEEIGGEVATMSSVLQLELIKNAKGAKLEEPIQLPKPVEKNVLDLMVEYAKFHSAPGRSDKERKIFDEKFVRLNTRTLCELTSAADSLDIRPLVDLTSRALARLIEGKTPEEIRETFNLPDDLTEEEKLEPVKAATEDPRIRLLNKYYAKKRKELQERKALEPPPVVQEDTRTVEELLSFIGAAADASEGKAAGMKSKAKKKKKKCLGGSAAADGDSAGPSGSHEGSQAGAPAAGDQCRANTNDAAGADQQPEAGAAHSSRSCSSSPVQLAHIPVNGHAGEASSSGCAAQLQQRLHRQDVPNAHCPDSNDSFQHDFEQQGYLSYVPHLPPHMPPSFQLFTKLTSLSDFRGRQVVQHHDGNGHADRLTDDDDGDISSSELLSNADDEDELVPALAGVNGSSQRAVQVSEALVAVVQEEMTKLLSSMGLAGHLQVTQSQPPPSPSHRQGHHYTAQRRLPDGALLSLGWRTA